MSDCYLTSLFSCLHVQLLFMTVTVPYLSVYYRATFLLPLLMWCVNCEKKWDQFHHVEPLDQTQKLKQLVVHHIKWSLVWYPTNVGLCYLTNAREEWFIKYVLQRIYPCDEHGNEVQHVMFMSQSTWATQARAQRALSKALQGDP